MTLKFGLLNNQFSTAKDDYLAHILQVKSHDTNSIIERMLNKGTMLTKTDIVAVLNLLTETLTDITADGETFNINIFRTTLSISGVFNSSTDIFDPKLHTINVNATAGKVLRDAVAKIKTEKIDIAESIPHLIEARDKTTQSKNNIITPNGIIEIVGKRLKIEGEEEKTGLFFINEDDGIEYKVTIIAENKPARIIAQIPTLIQGTYNIEIRSQSTQGGNLLKEPRIGRLNKSLRVM